MAWLKYFVWTFVCKLKISKTRLYISNQRSQKPKNLADLIKENVYFQKGRCLIVAEFRRARRARKREFSRPGHFSQAVRREKER